MVTSTTPLFASAVPSKICALPQPPVCPPPWNQTITGRDSDGLLGRGPDVEVQAVLVSAQVAPGIDG